MSDTHWHGTYTEELHVYNVMIQRIDPFPSAALGSSFTSRLPQLAVRMRSVPCRGTSASAGNASLQRQTTVW